MIKTVKFCSMIGLMGLAMTTQAFAGTLPVPEPASLTLLAVGAGGVVLAKLRRRK